MLVVVTKKQIHDFSLKNLIFVVSKNNKNNSKQKTASERKNK
jgi:hypothetical protein